MLFLCFLEGFIMKRTELEGEQGLRMEKSKLHPEEKQDISVNFISALFVKIINQ